MKKIEFGGLFVKRGRDAESGVGRASKALPLHSLSYSGASMETLFAILRRLCLALDTLSLNFVDRTSLESRLFNFPFYF